MLALPPEDSARVQILTFPADGLVQIRAAASACPCVASWEVARPGGLHGRVDLPPCQTIAPILTRSATDMIAVAAFCREGASGRERTARQARPADWPVNQSTAWRNHLQVSSEHAGTYEVVVSMPCSHVPYTLDGHLVASVLVAIRQLVLITSRLQYMPMGFATAPSTSSGIRRMPPTSCRAALQHSLRAHALHRRKCSIQHHAPQRALTGRSCSLLQHSLHSCVAAVCMTFDCRPPQPIPASSQPPTHKTCDPACSPRGSLRRRHQPALEYGAAASRRRCVLSARRAWLPQAPLPRPPAPPSRQLSMHLHARTCARSRRPGWPGHLGRDRLP